MQISAEYLNGEIDDDPRLPFLTSIKFYSVTLKCKYPMKFKRLIGISVLMCGAVFNSDEAASDYFLSNGQYSALRGDLAASLPLLISTNPEFQALHCYASVIVVSSGVGSIFTGTASVNAYMIDYGSLENGKLVYSHVIEASCSFDPSLGVATCDEKQLATKERVTRRYFVERNLRIHISEDEYRSIKLTGQFSVQSALSSNINRAAEYYTCETKVDISQYFGPPFSSEEDWKKNGKIMETNIRNYRSDFDPTQKNMLLRILAD